MKDDRLCPGYKRLHSTSVGLEPYRRLCRICEHARAQDRASRRGPGRPPKGDRQEEEGVMLRGAAAAREVPAEGFAAANAYFKAMQRAVACD